MFFRRDPYLKSEGNFFLCRVRTASGEVVPVRISKSAEISRTETGYYLRKPIVAPNSLDRAVLEVWFDRRLRPVKKTVEGGELVPIEEWVQL